MSENNFLTLLNQKQTLLADGATGTNLFAMGLEAGEAPELWNFEAPGKIADLHASFIQAGSDLILTNSFGGTRQRLKLHGLEGRVKEINAAAAKIACGAGAQVDRPVAIAGSVGPTGDLLEPLGELSYAKCVEAFAEQMAGLAEGGVDLFWIETIAAPEELRAATEAAKRFDLPVVATLSFDSAGSTMMGLSPQAYAELALSLGLDGFGANCGVGPSDMLATMLAFALVTTAADRPKVAKANCGIPSFADGKIVYSGTEEIMATYARFARDCGARIVGGCCGTTASHVAAMASALDGSQQGAAPDVAQIESLLGPMTDGGRIFANGGASAAETSVRRKSRRRTSA